MTYFARSIVVFLGTLALLQMLATPHVSATERSAKHGSRQTNGSEITLSVPDYCLNISDKAAEARIAWQTLNMKKLEGELEEKIIALEKRQIEVQVWVERQQTLLSAAGSGLIKIYAKMDPDAAARQLTKLDTRTASSVLRQLKPQEASAILNEMKPEQGAALVQLIAAAAKLKAGSQ